MRDHPIIGACHHGVVDVVVHAGLARPQAAEIALRVVLLEHPGLIRRLRAGHNHDVFLATGRAYTDAETRVLLAHDHNIVRLQGAYAVAPHGVRPPGVIDGGVEDELLPYPRRAVEDAFQAVLQQLTGTQILDEELKALVAGHVDRIGQQITRIAHRGRTEGEEVVAFGERVDVEKHLLPFRRTLLRDGRRSPRIGAFRHRDAAAVAILLPLLGAPVVPVLTAALGHGHVRLLDAGLDLSEDILGQGVQVRGLFCGVGVFSL